MQYGRRRTRHGASTKPAGEIPPGRLGVLTIVLSLSLPSFFPSSCCLSSSFSQDEVHIALMSRFTWRPLTSSRVRADCQYVAGLSFTLKPFALDPPRATSSLSRSSADHNLLLSPSRVPGTLLTGRNVLVQSTAQTCTTRNVRPDFQKALDVISDLLPSPRRVR